MSVRSFRTSSEDETIELGRQLARELPRHGVVLLIGDLGAGKTTLTKGIVEGLGVTSREEVTSPTFTLIHEYGDSVYHIDLYRLETQREVAGLGLDEMIDNGGLLLIEWGERFRSMWGDERVEIQIESELDTRSVTVSGLP